MNQPVNQPSIKFDACYCRYSSHAQDGSTSIDVQLDVCHKAAGGPCQDYIDRARTGRALAGREALLKLIADAEAGRIRRLFLYKFDRLGRSAETHAIVADLEDLGVEVISVTEGKEALSRGIQLVIAEHYSKALAERTRDGLIRRFEERTWTGGEPPYGYQVVSDAQGKRRIAINPAEADVVKLIFKYYLSATIGAKRIAQQLHRDGWPTRRGADWSFTTVRGILINPILTGEVRYLRRQMKLSKETGRRLPRAVPAPMTYTDESLRLISASDFDQAQAKIKQRQRPRGAVQAARGVRPFTGLLYCEECGSLFYAKKHVSKGGDQFSYSCSRRQRHGADGCNSQITLKESHLLDFIKVNVADVFNEMDSILAEATGIAREKLKQQQHRLTDLQSQLSATERQSKSISTLMLDVEVEPDAKRALSRQLADVERRRDELMKLCADEHQRSAFSADEVLNQVRIEFERLRSSLSGSSPSELHSAIERGFGPMLVRHDGRIAQKNTPASEAGVISNIAGARCDTVHQYVQDVIWTRLRAA